jgi:hypothetical protein
VIEGDLGNYRSDGFGGLQVHERLQAALVALILLYGAGGRPLIREKVFLGGFIFSRTFFGSPWLEFTALFYGGESFAAFSTLPPPPY